MDLIFPRMKHDGKGKTRWTLVEQFMSMSKTKENMKSILNKVYHEISQGNVKTQSKTNNRHGKRASQEVAEELDSLRHSLWHLRRQISFQFQIASDDSGDPLSISAALSFRRKVTREESEKRWPDL
ncbi:hypothetical protein NC652_006197 [Populus alba x Populus x berolinensis]|nr:hypothetical protein NC652_006197 [Populus alba x Populus x berolinensis]